MLAGFTVVTLGLTGRRGQVVSWFYSCYMRTDRETWPSCRLVLQLLHDDWQGDVAKLLAGSTVVTWGLTGRRGQVVSWFYSCYMRTDRETWPSCRLVLQLLHEDWQRDVAKLSAGSTVVTWGLTDRRCQVVRWICSCYMRTDRETWSSLAGSTVVKWGLTERRGQVVIWTYGCYVRTDRETWPSC